MKKISIIIGVFIIIGLSIVNIQNRRFMLRNLDEINVEIRYATNYYERNKAIENNTEINETWFLLGESIPYFYHKDMLIEPRCMNLAQKMEQTFDLVASSRVASRDDVEQFYSRLNQIELLITNTIDEIELLQLDISEETYDELITLLLEMENLTYSEGDQ
ncbi:hypothetical protein QE109_17445 [Fusibacter bizertensis]|uniref:DUF4363 family protein n=1 Tax=Fusibacter bizertensis TaxID=1488331 RepID=A0ABT6NHP7_9FIRM|nr:hypothetical protein [Fusibacter bizertensis]MDH8679936.1 hypothetical protein [Fusibacter bizertensis]